MDLRVWYILREILNGAPFNSIEDFAGCIELLGHGFHFPIVPWVLMG